MLSTKAGLLALAAVLESVSTVQGTVGRGVPESFARSITGYVAVGLPTITRWAAGGTVQVEATYFIGLGYATEGAEEAAEEKLADTLDELVRKVEADPSLGGVFKALIWVAPGVNHPEYETVVGQEFRHIRLVVSGKMEETIEKG